jgi:lipoate-protein ligase A
MSIWQNLTKYLKEIGWISRIASWTKNPQLQIVNKVIVALNELLAQLKKYLMRKNEKISDQINQTTESTGGKIEEERQKPLPEQNNETIKEEMRRRHDRYN